MMLKSLGKLSNQMIWHTVAAIDLYSAFAQYLETVCCFFDLHDTNDSSQETQ